MAPRQHLTTGELARVVDRVGISGTESIGGPPRGFVDTTNPIESLELAVSEPDSDHWVYPPAERVPILQRLMLSDGSPWVARFGFLLAMSVVIATLGLANDQPAVVIAAMIIAPLMTPVLGIACCTTLGLVHQTLRLTLIVIAASVGAVGLGWVISASLVVHELTGEELSRTSPRLRDFVVALAAGAAGMYSVVRKDLSGVVSGVAIAVALVPPLATIGIVLELQEWSLARGAALLYLMNVMAIILAATVVLLVTDFIRSPSLRDTKVAASGAAVAVLSVAISVPVWQNSRSLDRETTFSRMAEAAVLDWDQAHPSHRVVLQRIEPGLVSLVITGPTEPTSLDELRAAVTSADFPVPTVEVEWARSSMVEIGPAD